MEFKIVVCYAGEAEKTIQPLFNDGWIFVSCTPENVASAHGNTGAYNHYDFI